MSEPNPDLVAAATQARKAAYAPYSEFKVGSAVLTGSGQIFSGCNVENASYGLALCAERNAISSAVAAGERSFRSLVVVAEPLASPCGACRQFVFEFGDEIEVWSIDLSGTVEPRRWTSSELLPEGFRLSPSDD